MGRICTVGHGTLDADAFVALVGAAGVDMVVDVRRYPGSRRNPHTAPDSMKRWLADAGIDYRWIEALGGRRRPDPASRHTALRNDQFRAYADHMESRRFRDGIDELVLASREHSVAIMCAESVWWRCHRRLISDHLVLLEGLGVAHLFHDGRLTDHEPMAAARVDGDAVVYDLD